MKLVADKAGVSLATASYALQNHPKISEETRLHVQQVAEALGYRPNATVSRLMAELRADQRGDSTIAWINCHPNRDIYTTVPWLRGWLTGARNRADQLGYGFEEFWLHEAGMTPERLKEILLTRGIAGVMLAPTWSTNGVSPIDVSVFPVVSVSGVFSEPVIHQACSNSYANVVLALDEMRRLGYRKIGLFSHLQGRDLAVRQVAGAFLEWQRDLPERARSTPLIYDEIAPDVEGVFLRWLKKNHFDAILSTGSKPRQWLHHGGLRVPEDIGLAHLNLAEDVAGWAGINPLLDQVAGAAVDLLIGQIQRHEAGAPPVPKMTTINGLWVSGETLRKVGA